MDAQRDGERHEGERSAEARGEKLIGEWLQLTIEGGRAASAALSVPLLPTTAQRVAAALTLTTAGSSASPATHFTCWSSSSSGSGFTPLRDRELTLNPCATAFLKISRAARRGEEWGLGLAAMERSRRCASEEAEVKGGSNKEVHGREEGLECK